MSLILISLLTLLAASVGTMTGFGTSTIMIPILSLFFPFAETLLFVGVIHWFGNIWKMLLFRKGANWKLIFLFGIPGVVVGFAAARLPLVLPELLLQRALGLFLIAYVVFLFNKPKWKVEASSLGALVGGSLSGLFAGLFGVGGAIRSTFLTSFDLKKSVFLFTSGAIGLLIDFSRLSQYLLHGTRLKGEMFWILLVCIPVSLIGAHIAKYLVNKIPQKSFRIFITVGLLVVGLRYILLP